MASSSNEEVKTSQVGMGTYSQTDKKGFSKEARGIQCVLERCLSTLASALPNFSPNLVVLSRSHRFCIQQTDLVFSILWHRPESGKP